MIKTINSTTLRSHFKDALTHVKESKQPLIVTERNVPTVILVDIDEYEDALSAKDKKYLQSIKKARTQYKKGDVFDLHDVFSDVV